MPSDPPSSLARNTVNQADGGRSTPAAVSRTGSEGRPHATMTIWNAIRATWAISRKGMLAGEAIVYHHGAEGGRESAPEGSRGAGRPGELALWTARYAERRYREFRTSDLAGKYELEAGWMERRG